MFEFIFQIIGEILIQAVTEALVELGFRSLVEPLRKPPNPWLAAFGYFLFGAILGGVSLWIFSHHIVTSPDWRIVNLIITPVLVGLLMSGLGAWRARRGQTVLRIDRFSYGYIFALSFALVRFLFAN